MYPPSNFEVISFDQAVYGERLIEGFITPGIEPVSPLNLEVMQLKGGVFEQGPSTDAEGPGDDHREAPTSGPEM